MRFGSAGAFVPLLLFGLAATMVGMAVGWYMSITSGLPISDGVLIIIALMFTALLVAFHGGRARTDGSPQPQSLTQSWDAFRRELDRSRRFERPFVLLRIPDGSTFQGSSVGAPAHGAAGALLLALRGIDHAWTMGGSIYVALPECDRAAAMGLIARLRTTISDASALNEVQLAEFPVDGLTTGALVANLRTVPAPGEVVPVRLVTKQDGPDAQRETRSS